MVQRARVYVDGYNFYYGVVRGTTFKWLDLEALFSRLLPELEVERILYFTARVRPAPWDPTAHIRQGHYLAALRTLPSVEIIEGTFSRSFPALHMLNPRNLAPAAERDWSYPTVFVWKNEEKGSDVSLGARLVFDGCRGAYDVAVIVTNDSDLLEPVRLVTRELGLPVYAVLPATDRTKKQRRKSVFEGRATSVPVTHISWSTLRKCQFPDVIKTASGEIRKPGEWS